MVLSTITYKVFYNFFIYNFVLHNNFKSSTSSVQMTNVCGTYKLMNTRHKYLSDFFTGHSYRCDLGVLRDDSIDCSTVILLST